MKPAKRGLFRNMDGTRRLKILKISRMQFRLPGVSRFNFFGASPAALIRDNGLTLPKPWRFNASDYLLR